MREIKFRGFDELSKTWRYGAIIKMGSTVYIIEKKSSKVGVIEDIEPFFSSAREVIPETVGQYTGLKDKNGAEIYDGDVVRAFDGVEWFSSFVYEDSGYFKIGIPMDNECLGVYCYCDNIDGTQIEVVGNIHDNPELLGGKE